MSKIAIYETHQFCVTGDTREEAQSLAEAWLSQPVPSLDDEGNELYDEDGNPLTRPKFEVIKDILIQQLPSSDGSVMLIYTIIGQRDAIRPDFHIDRR